MPKPGQAVRAAAIELMTAVTDRHRLLSEVLPEAVAALDPAERARAQRLATGGLRWADRADRLLGPHLRRKPMPDVLNALRLGTWEICGEGAAPYGVVDGVVGAVRSRRRTARAAGLVNAVLRRIAEGGREAWDALPVPRLPRWLRRPLLATYGRAAVEAMEAAHAAGAPLDLTPRDGDAETLARATGGDVLATGSVRLAGARQVSALPGYDDGLWWVQDAAAALPARILDARPGERVLDLCAAPGGKTLQLAATGAEVTALDLSEARMERLAENLARCRLEARRVVADATEWEDAPFDAVLLDAPCTATGTIRRHPDLPHARSAAELPALLDLQARLLDRAVALTRPGGRLVFCTCSLFPEEGEGQVAAALERHPGLRLDPAPLARPGVEADWIGDGLRLRPDFWAERGGIDGFYIAALRRGG